MQLFDQATLGKVEKVGTKVGVSWLKKRTTRVNQVKGGSCDFVDFVEVQLTLVFGVETFGNILGNSNSFR